jgi:hypothetical protein
MSSGGKHLGIHGPIGLFMAIIPVVFTLQDALKWGRAYVLTIYSLLALAIAVGKVQRPLMWEYYQAQPMFIDRAVISHPLYGPMVVDRTINRFFSGVCQTIRTSNTNRELLSLPYSYANYYCGITPWHQNVQTFIDTSNILTIRKIQNGLSTQPPGWILYQRQLQILSLMEFFFNHGRRVPQRDLDDLIEGKIARGTWKVVSHWQEQPGDDWLLIQTTPGRS